jgi:uncharacterized protein YoxC
MSVLSSAVPSLLLQVGRTLPDTVLTKQVAVDMGIFQKIATVGSTILAIAILLLAVAFLIAAWDLRKTYKELRQIFDRVYEDVVPVLRNASLVADDVREITTTVKGNVRQVQQTVASANTRLLNAVRETEAQIQRFNSLLGVVREEAESAFVSTASTVRGVRTGLETMLNYNEEELDDVDAAPEPPPNQRPRVRSRRHERVSRS